VLVALLLGVLAFFDYLATARMIRKTRCSQTGSGGAGGFAAVTPAGHTSPAPEKTEAPVEAPPPPRVEAKPETRRARQSSCQSRLFQKRRRQSRSDDRAVNILPPQRAAQPADPAKLAGHVVEARQAPAVSRLFSGFLLQAGVANVQRAEELHARLTLSGVKSTLETRVQVGPFKTRQEAESAQAKLKELGVETILVPPKGKN
jgi:DedD protein